MKRIFLLLCLLYGYSLQAQTVYPWGSATGKSQAKGELQTDSGLHFIPRMLGKFAGTNDSACSVQVSRIDSQLYYTKNGHTWTKVAISGSDSNLYFKQGGDHRGVNDSLGPIDSARNIIFLTGTSIPMIIYGNGRVSIGTTPDEVAYVLGIGGGIRVHNAVTPGAIYSDDNIKTGRHFTDLGAVNNGDSTYLGVAVFDNSDTIKYRPKREFLTDLSYRFIADPLSNIPSAITNIVDIGSTNRSKAGTFNFIIGAKNGGVASGSNAYNFVIGNADSIMGTGSTSFNRVLGSRMTIGDSTADMQFNTFIGDNIRVWNKTFTMNYYHAFGASNKIYQKGTSNVPSMMVGSNNTDSVSSSGAGFGTYIFGDSWINRHQQSICIGSYGNHDVTSNFTTREDYSMNIASTGGIYFHVGGHDTALTIKYSTGAVLINTNTDNTFDINQVNGSFISKGLANSIISKTANYTALNSDFTILVDATSGNITITLPVTGISTGKIYNIKKIAGSNNVVLDPAGAATIDGAATYTISALLQANQVQFDGTNWWIL